ncbi:hypothetical protein ACFQZV_01515 [Microbacterium koreense]|uniref:DUF2127 domain-containing protein n=1 Tax=Microbacterium koreense TaxID=323761 RepID=A0ABW2ZNT2_9MICO
MSGTPAKRPAFEPASRLLAPTGYEPDMPRPSATVAGALLVGLRVLAGIVIIVVVALNWSHFVSETAGQLGDAGADGDAVIVLAVIVALGAVVVIIDAVLAFGVLRGNNVARIILMVVSTGSITGVFIGWWAQGQEITLQGTFVSLSLDILILLALSSRSAAAYARRNERR